MYIGVEFIHVYRYMYMDKLHVCVQHCTHMLITEWAFLMSSTRIHHRSLTLDRIHDIHTYCAMFTKSYTHVLYVQINWTRTHTIDHCAWAMAADATLWVGPWPLAFWPRAYVTVTTSESIVNDNLGSPNTAKKLLQVFGLVFITFSQYQTCSCTCSYTHAHTCIHVTCTQHIYVHSLFLCIYVCVHVCKGNGFTSSAIHKESWFLFQHLA